MSVFLNNEIISNVLNGWDFIQAEELKRKFAKIDYKYIPDYCRFLADIGKLDVLEKYLTEINKNNFLHTNIRSLPDYYIYSHLYSKITSLFYEKEGFFSRLYKSSMNNDNLSLIKLLREEGKNNLSQDTTAENNMILNFAYNKLFESRQVDLSLSSLLIDHVFSAKEINHTRKQYILNQLVNYFSLDSHLCKDFFRLKEQYYNHIQKLMSMIHYFSDDVVGAKYAMDKLFYQIQKANNLSIKSDCNNPRVAICISGMSRNDTRGISSIFEYLAIPLNADVFMHTWDLQQDWVGGARANDRFWFRTFNVDESKMPKNLLNLSFLKDNYPNIFISLMTASFSSLNKEYLLNEFKFTRFLSENQEQFLLNHNIGDSYKSRESFNQIKMFYGMHRVFSLLEDCEREHGYKYDYIIKVRPDLVIKKGVTFTELDKLSKTEIAVPTGFYGIQDMVFYASRDCYKQIIDIYPKMLNAKSLSPFTYFPKYDAHALMFAQLLHNNIKPVLCHIKYNIEEGIRGLKVPNLKEALIKDCNIKNRLKYPKETEWLEGFLTEKAK